MTWNDRMTMPLPEDTPQPQLTATISSEVREEASKAFQDFCLSWVTNFEVKGEQPDRVSMMQAIGQGRVAYGIIVMAYELESLQELVYRALKAKGFTVPSLDWLERVSGTMVQVCREGFPDLAGTLDYSQRWRRKLSKEFA